MARPAASGPGKAGLGRRLAPYVRPYLGTIALAFVVMAIYGLSGTGRVVFGKLLFDYVLPEGGAPWWTVMLGWDRLDLLVGLCACGCALAVVIAVSGYVREYLISHTLYRIVMDVQNDLFHHLSTLSLRFHHHHKVGDLMSRITNDLSSTGAVLVLVFSDLLLQPISLGASVFWCLFFSWKLTVLLVAVLPVMIVPMVVLGRRIRDRAHGRQVLAGRVVEAMQQLFGGIRTVKAFGAEEAESERFRAVNLDAFRKSMRVVRARLASRGVLEFLNNFGVPIIIFVGGWAVISGGFDMSPGDLVGFMGSVAMMYMPLRIFSKAYNMVQESQAGAQRVFELLDEEAEIRDVPDAVDLDGIRRGIRLRDVHFGYEREPVLRGVDLEVRVGETIALVGPSGAGKSTLLDLLPRFHDPDRGAVEVDGVDLRRFRRSTLLDHIAVVGQDPYLFNTTIGANIRYGRPAASQAEVEAAARAAYIHDFIAGLPQGYETEVGERGVMVSGGQRQRLTIARALLKDAAVLLLDEATSSLDSESEREVQRALDNLMAGRTCFVIAHRLSTVIHADRIAVVEEGRIADVGRHEELLGRCPTYARLYAMQFGEGAGVP
ncbi:MAG: ABC transporter ATP-binding protein [Planctomycetes bacterium]|nr:ABC transporter ATP-binding protein [Planctomycetota bacterium]